MYTLGYDIGSSSVKASILNVNTGEVAGSGFSPKKEMPMLAVQPGWAEQDPAMWWENAKKAFKEALSNAKIKASQIEAIGISYQMHGLVIVDDEHEVLRPAIIWCDSRAVEIGQQAFEEIGEKKCLEHLLNSPGNFTASKLKWVKSIERDLYDRTYKFILPGDYIAMKLSGEIQTTASGLSEGVLWDFKQNTVADIVLDEYKIKKELVPTIVPTFGFQAAVNEQAAAETGLKKGTPIAYRAGDQPNNAFSLQVLHPGEVAATAGTSAVIYAVTDKNAYDKKSRVNTFLHVNNTETTPRNGVLLCINGSGILNSWLKNQLFMGQYSYDDMNKMAQKIPHGSQLLHIYPFGNGGERMLNAKNTGAQVKNLNFNIHTPAHIMRAAQEGIVFGLKYGFEVMEKMSLQTTVIKTGFANLFLSPIFRDAFVNTMGVQVELYNTDGSQGAARGAALGAHLVKDEKAAFKGLKKLKTLTPSKDLRRVYNDLYAEWKSQL